MKKIGIINVDGHHFPNLALLKIAGYFQNKGIPVEWASPLPESYDTVYASKVFTFTPEYNYAVRPTLPGFWEQTHALWV